MAMKFAVSTALALAAPCAGHQALRGLRLSQQTIGTEVAVAGADLATLASVEAEDRRFWLSEWDSVEADLLKLRALTANTIANATSNATAKAAPVHEAAGNATKAAVPAAASNASQPEHHKSLLKGIKMNLNPKTPADLIPALAMLKGLYETGKDRIAQLNVREQESKKQFEQRQIVHKARLAEIEARGKNHTLSPEFVTNETRDENRFFSYWERVRDRQHHSFHLSLNIQHGMMQRVKSMMDVYEKAIAGKKDDSFQKELSAIMGGGFVLVQEAARSFCGTALVEIRAERAALRSGVAALNFPGRRAGAA